MSKKIHIGVVLFFILAEVCIFFFMPTAIWRSAGYFSYATAWNLLLQPVWQLSADPYVVVQSPFSAGIILPYLSFIIALSFALRGKSKGKFVFSLILVCLSCVLFFLFGENFSYGFGDSATGYSGYCGGGIGQIFYLALCLAALGYLFVRNFRTPILKKQR